MTARSDVLAGSGNRCYALAGSGNSCCVLTMCGYVLAGSGNSCRVLAMCWLCAGRQRIHLLRAGLQRKPMLCAGYVLPGSENSWVGQQCLEFVVRAAVRNTADA